MTPNMGMAAVMRSLGASRLTISEEAADTLDIINEMRAAVGHSPIAPTPTMPTPPQPVSTLGARDPHTPAGDQATGVL